MRGARAARRRTAGRAADAATIEIRPRQRVVLTPPPGTPAIVPVRPRRTGWGWALAVLVVVGIGAGALWALPTVLATPPAAAAPSPSPAPTTAGSSPRVMP